MNTLQSKLSHSRAAYVHSINSLPDSENIFPLSSLGLTFTSPSQRFSMIIELGWAFFCRYEACFEKYLKDQRIQLDKKLSLLEWLNNKSVQIPETYKDGLSLYRKIRNKLHHEDGSSFTENIEEEIQLLPEHMENFYNLFIWCGEIVESNN